MSWWREFADRIEHDVPVGRLTWFRLGGRARYAFHPRDAADLAAMIARTRSEAVPVKVLGGGANVLICDDGFDGVVVRLDSEVFKTVDRQGSSFDLGAGVDLMPFARQCSAEGFAGLECMAGIPASVGGAVRMNAGGGPGELGAVVKQIDVLGPDGFVETWPHERIGFGYRHSELGDRIVLAARIELVEDDPVRVKRTFDKNFQDKQRSQPLSDNSAGCIFKNPAGESAGALIDRAGLKGVSCGQAKVSDRHANFIVAGSGATAADVLDLIDLVRERVRDRFGTELEVEIDIWRASQTGAAR